MKKKIILALTACLFAAGSIINMHLAQNSHAMDVSLADISVMAQADGESGGGGFTYCWTNPTLGGINTVTPCGPKNSNYLPPYECGTPIPFCNTGGSYEQCHPFN